MDSQTQLDRMEALLNQILELLLTVLETADDDSEPLLDFDGHAHGSPRSLDIL